MKHVKEMQSKDLLGNPLQIMNNISKHIKNLRKEYLLAKLDEKTVEADPLKQYSLWFHEAINAEIHEPNAMSLATATLDGKPSVRIVLLKEFDENGFVFYTNYNSRKGKELAINPWGALTFYWAELQRQVRLEGKITNVSPETSDIYFKSRPKGSQIGALVSNQSQIIYSREEIEKRYLELEAFYSDKEIERPQHWGGYTLKPETIEFWQGRTNRLHDRILYKFEKDVWSHLRLAP